MPKDEFTLPTGEHVTRIYAVAHPGKGTTYLNAVRIGVLDENSLVAQEYHGMKEIYARQLATEVRSHVSAFDAVISPPSSRNDAEPYRQRLLDGTDARELTQRFTRNGKVKAGDSDTTLEALIEEFVYEPDGSEGSTRSLLIVDESTASGKTVAAVLSRMRDAGLPNDCEITVVAWAKLGD